MTSVSSAQRPRLSPWMVKAIRRGWFIATGLLIGILLVLIGLWVAQAIQFRHPAPAATLRGSVSSLQLGGHAGCIAIAGSSSVCGPIYAMSTLHVGEPVRFSQIEVAVPDGSERALVVTKPAKALGA